MAVTSLDGAHDSGRALATSNPKRPLPQNEPGMSTSSSPAKKPRLQLPGTSQNSFQSQPHLQHQDQVETLAAEHNLSGLPALPTEVQEIASQYDFTPMSILSSAKMERKIGNVLDRVNKFSFTDTKAKPGVVILHAKADVASKMIGIAELAKREMEKDKGKWYQYSKIESQVTEKKRGLEGSERAVPGKTLGEWENHRQSNSGQEQTSRPDPAQQPQRDAMMIDQEQERKDDDDEEEEAFETVATTAIGPHKGGQKVRAIPIMTIYLSRVPVPVLKSIYG